MTETFFTLSDLPDGEWESFDRCRGDACDALKIRGNRRPNSNTLRSVTVHNEGDKTIKFKFVWGDFLGGCAVSTEDSVFPHETFEVMAPNEILLGFCSWTANYSTLVGDDEREGASCHWDGADYADGTIVCISDLDHRCKNGRWRALGTSESCK